MKKTFFRKLLNIFTKQEQKQALLLFLMSLAAAFAQAIGVASVFPFINVLLKPEMIQENRWLSLFYQKGGFSDIKSFIIILGLGVFSVVLLSSLISAVTIWAKSKFALGKNHSLSKRLLNVYLAKPYEYFLINNTNELGKNILSEINQLTSHLLISLFEIIINGLMVITVIGMLLLVNVSVTIGAMVLVGGAYGLTNYYIKKKLQTVGRERIEANKERFRLADEALSSVKITKVMGIESYFIENFSLYSKKFTQYNIYSHIAGEIPRFIFEAIAFGGIVFYIVLMVYQGENMSNFVPLLSLYAFAAYRIMPSLNRFYKSMTKIYYNSPILDKIYHDLKQQEKEDPEKKKTAFHRDEKRIEFNHAIKLKNLRFCYSDNRINVINGIDLVIPKNSMIGIAGETGCGKTTFVDIILGLLEPQGGRILIDEIPLTSENLAGWLNIVGYVPQEIYLSDQTIRNNIAFGVPEEKINDQQVQSVARIAALDRFIEDELPHQYNTLIGERGVRLSGGQRQRIGLARALYRNPEVLILDEATSSLDGATEESILNAIQEVLKLKTVIMIAHRLSTLRDYDQIYIMEKGRMIGQGTYEELIKHHQKFKEMAKIPKE